MREKLVKVTSKGDNFMVKVDLAYGHLWFIIRCHKSLYTFQVNDNF